MMSGRTGSHRSCLVGYVLLHCLCTIREGGRTLWEGSVMMSGRTGSHTGGLEAVWCVPQGGRHSYTVSGGRQDPVGG